MKDNFETEDFAFLQDIDLSSYREDKKSREDMGKKKSEYSVDDKPEEDYLYSEPRRKNTEDFYHEDMGENESRHRTRRSRDERVSPKRNKEERNIEAEKDGDMEQRRNQRRRSGSASEKDVHKDTRTAKKKTKRSRSDYRDNRKEEKTGFIDRISDAVADMSTVDHILALTGVIVVFILVVTVTFFFSSRISKKQMGEFVGIGENLNAISVMGESSLIAAADNYGSRQDGLEDGIDWESEDFDDEEGGEKSDENQGVDAISLNLTSVEKDLKIKFVNKKNGKLIKGIAFKVEVVTPSGSTDNYTNDDMDGIIYKKNMTPGEYSVALVDIDEIKDFEYSTTPVKVTVKDHIEYKKIDVSDEVKTEAEVNVAAEDTQKKDAESSPVLKDTVEWVESTKKIVSHEGEDTNDGENSYIRVSKDDVADPAKSNETSEANLSMLSILDGGKFAYFTISGGEEDCEHEWGEWKTTTKPTCKNTGEKKRTCAKCSAADIEELSVDKDNHAWSKWEITKEASCKEEGQQERTCSECDKKETESIKKTSDHKWSDYDSTGKRTCSVCETSETDLSKHTHKWGDWKDGKRTCTISDCNETETCKHDKTEEKTEGGKKKTYCTTCKYLVSETDADSSISGIEISGKTSFKVDEETTITAKVSGSNLKEKSVTWKVKSNDKIVEEVKNDGDTLKLKGLKAGTATYTVKYDDGKSSSSKDVTITVEEKGKLTISLNAEVVPCPYNKHAEVKVTVSGGSPDYTFTFKSDDERYIRVRSDDKVTTKDKTVTLDVKRVDTEENQKDPKATKVYITVTDSTGLKAEKEVTFTAADNTTVDKKAPLKDKKGNLLYVRDKDTGKYREATAADYENYDKFYRLNDNAEYSYTGWQNINGKSYYFDKNGKKVTGDQVIKGVKYSFDGDGVLKGSSGNNAGGAGMGIDVSKWNGSIDWQKVKDNGVEFVIIRCGYRGSSTGALIQDPKFKSYVSGARAVGLKIGVYFFTQAVNEVEAVEEASMVLNMVGGAGLSYPIYLDVESSGGRGDAIDKGTRTSVINAFCKTIQNGGYKVGVYANKTWLESKISTGSLNTGNIWLAQYTDTPTYGGKFGMWQYTSKGQINGISGYVDLNKAY